MDLLAFALYLAPEKQSIEAKHKGWVAIRRNANDYIVCHLCLRAQSFRA